MNRQPRAAMLLCAAIAAAASVTPPLAHADDFDWNQPAGGSFTNGAFWTDSSAGNTTGVAPTGTDNALFNLAPSTPAFTVTARQDISTNQVVVAGNNVTMDVSDGAGNPFLYDLLESSPTSSFSNASLFVADASSLTFTAGNILAGDVNVGSSDAGGAALTLTNAAAQMTVFSFYTLQNFATINVQSNATLAMSDDSVLTQSANGSINLSGGAGLLLGDAVVVSGGALHVNDGYISAQGSSLTYDSLYYDSDLDIGGTGFTMNLTSSLFDSQSNIIPTTITGNVNASGSTINIIGSVVQLTPNNGTSWTSFNVSGSAQINIQTSILTTGNMILDGDPAPAAGSLTTVGPSDIIVHGDFYVGDLGNATLNATGGANVIPVDGAFIIGNAATATGTVLLDGVGGTIDTGVNVANSTYGNGQLIVGKNGAGNLTISGGASVVVSDSLYIGQTSNGNGTGGTGIVTITGSGLNGNTSVPSQLNLFTGDVFVGNDTSTSGTLNVSNGALLSNVIGFIAPAPGSTGIVTLSSNATWNNSSYLEVSDHGNATLTIQTGATLSVNDINMAFYPDGVSNLTVDNATVNNAGFITVANDGAATLTIRNGANVSDTDANIGFVTGSNGTASVDGASQWINSGFLEIASGGNGTLHITNGASVSDDFGGIGRDAGSNGNVSVSASSWINTGQLIVGSSGNGTLSISSNATVSATATTVIASGAGSNGNVSITGAGSHLAIAAQLVVGNDGTGSLTISNGALVSCQPGSSPTGSAAIIGQEGAAVGTVVVTGLGSTFTASEHLSVGFGNNSVTTTNGGTGSLSILSGGLVSDANGYVGRYAGSSGNVSLSGANSTWTNTGSFFIAANDPANNPANATLAAGAGNVSIATGSSISAASSALIGPAGTLTLAGGTLIAPAVTNNGAITGAGTITGNLTNSASLSIPLASTISLSGNYSQTANNSLTGNGTLVANALFGNLSTVAGIVRVRSNGANSATSLLNTLTLAGSANNWTGDLDITNNKLIFEATPTTKATALATLQNQALFGRTHAAGITSSTLPATEAVAVVDNALLGRTSFGGQIVDANSILVAPELLGDTNLDGSVNTTDLNTVLNNFGKVTSAWTAGNFDGAATIDLTDLANVLNNLGRSIPNPTTAAPPPVPAPEPATLALLASATFLLRPRRRRK